MGECLITRRGGEVKKIPILHSSYPADVTVSVVDSSAKTVFFTAEISEPGYPNIYTYQWYVNGSVVTGATGATYVRTVTADKGVYKVWCEVTNKAGTVRTRNATLTVNKLPVLNAGSPDNVTAELTDSKILTVSVAEHGYPASYTYQWYKNGTAVSGATSSSYTFTPTAVGTTTVYCKVTNSAGTVTSRTATITATAKYLYNAGNEYTDITGGFNTAVNRGTVTKNADHILLKGADWVDRNTRYVSCYTAKQIDITNFKTLIGVCETYLKDNYGWIKVCLTNNLTLFTSCSENNYKAITGTELKGTGAGNRVEVRVDISAMSGIYYLGAYGGDCVDNKLYSLRLE